MARGEEAQVTKINEKKERKARRFIKIERAARDEVNVSSGYKNKQERFSSVLRYQTIGIRPARRVREQTVAHGRESSSMGETEGRAGSFGDYRQSTCFKNEGRAEERHGH